MNNLEYLPEFITDCFLEENTAQDFYQAASYALSQGFKLVIHVKDSMYLGSFHKQAISLDNAFEYTDMGQAFFGDYAGIRQELEGENSQLLVDITYGRYTAMIYQNYALGDVETTELKHYTSAPTFREALISLNQEISKQPKRGQVLYLFGKGGQDA